jgi:flavin reductase (DIM6/NTAB) family NADH-FMN oxidoreductase RutF
MHIHSNEIETLERFYRANLINSITGYKAANLIGTVNKKGISNVAIFSSVIHLGANPALIGFIQRPITEQSHTYKNIIENGVYTINHIHPSFLKNAHYTSAKFEEGISEFNTCHLTESFIENFTAPFVQESSVKIGLQFVQEMPIELNKTTLIIGKIVHIIVQQDDLINIDGNIDLEKANSVSVAGLESYYTAKKTAHYGYAQTNNLPTFE